jgi:hypothetical protein
MGCSTSHITSHISYVQRRSCMAYLNICGNVMFKDGSAVILVGRGVLHEH